MKCEACQNFIAFLQRVYISNNTGARMLDSIYHITLKSILNLFLV